MIKKIFAVLLLSLAVSACESNPAETNSSASNANAKPAQASPTMAPSPSAEPSPFTAQLKAGDKVKIMVDRSPTEATVVSVDEKLNKVTVKVQSESKERTVGVADIIRQ
jgi:outer membrane lipoprotein-sorting protein